MEKWELNDLIEIKNDWKKLVQEQAEKIEEQQREIEHLKFVMRKYHKYAAQDFAKKYGIEL